MGLQGQRRRWEARPAEVAHADWVKAMARLTCRALIRRSEVAAGRVLRGRTCPATRREEVRVSTAKMKGEAPIYM